MQIESLLIPGMAMITPRRFGDARGWFMESWSAARLADIGLAFDVVQDNHAYTSAAGTLRGLHLQAEPFAQSKLVRCIRGAIFDVAVDLRAGSPAFGRWVGVELDAAKGAQALIPKGCLHGYMTLADHTEVEYKVDAPYAPEADRAVRWDDPEIGVEWPLARLAMSKPILSDKDAAAASLAELDARFTYAASSA